MRKFIVIFTVLFITLGAAKTYADSVSDGMTYFYRSSDPNAIVGLLQNLEKQGVLKRKSTHPSVIGFIAGLYVQFPDHRAEWMSAPYGPAMRQIIAVAVSFSGDRDQALRYASEHQMGNDFASYLDQQKYVLTTVPLSGPSELDMMWGASFSTGDPIYTNRIIDRLARTIENVAIDPADIELVSKVKSGLAGPRDLTYLKEKYSKAEALDLIVASTALWSLRSNAQQHEFIKKALSERIQTADNKIADSVLKRALFSVDERLIVSASTDNVNFIVFATQKADAVKNDLTSGIYDSFGPFAQNEFFMDDEIHIVVLAYTKSATDADVVVKLTTPSGTMDLGRLARYSDTAMYFHILTVSPDALSKEGVYSVHGSFSGQNGGQDIFVKRVFVSKG